MALERRAYTAPSRRRLRPGRQAVTSRRAAAVSAEASSVSSGGAAAGADLGGSSKYTNELFVD